MEQTKPTHAIADGLVLVIVLVLAIAAAVAPLAVILGGLPALVAYYLRTSRRRQHP